MALTAEEIAERTEAIRLEICRDWAGCGSTRRLHELLAKAPKRELAERRKIPVALREQVLASGPCEYCGDFATQVDHRIPITQGGTSHPSNLVPACRWCNAEKLDWTVEQWREWRLEQEYPWPPESRTSMIVRMVQDAMPPIPQTIPH